MTDDRTATPSTDARSAPTPDDSETDEARRHDVRENARRVLRESGVAEILQTLNRQALQGRGWFEEYDSGVIFKWGTAFTRRHIWVDVVGDQLRFRLNPHIRCSSPTPACDGEYHVFTSETWRLPGVILHEVDRNYRKPVAETSDD